jgi:phenylacetate-CoA ligase
VSLFKIVFWLKGYPFKEAKKVLSKEVDEVLLLDNLRTSFKGKLPEFDGLIENKEFMIEKSFLRNYYKQLPSTRGLYQGKTSGSSGDLLKFVKSKLSHAIAWLLIDKAYLHLGVKPHDKQARFYGMPQNGLSHYVEVLKDRIMNRRRFVVHDMSQPALEQFISRFARDKFDYVYGYTNALHHFSKYLLKQEQCLKDICPSLKCVIVTAEQCFPEIRSEIERAFGIPVYIEYGCSEVGVIAMENKEQELIVHEAHVKLEAVNENGELVKEGAIGYFLVTDLYNTAMPFIRYKLGDMGSVARNEKGALLITSLQGRISEQIVFPNGEVSPGLTLYYVMNDVMHAYPSLGQYQIVQEANYYLHFTLQCDTIIQLEIVELTRNIEELVAIYLPGIPGVSCEIANKIDALPNGKFKHFISKVNEA